MFKLSDLVKMYASNLDELGVEHGRIHSTDLKNRIIAQLPDLQSHKEGAAEIIRRDIINHKLSEFNGTFDKNL